MEIIKINNITQDFSGGRGVFDLSFSINQGEVYGFLGPNGAGKTTTIRNLMGFSYPDKGECSIVIGGREYKCFEDAAKIQKRLGYLAGEIAFPDDMKGNKLLDFLADMKELQDRTRMKELIDMFELNPTGVVKKMSKGMKQKIGIINAFMTRPEVIILDEPTSGLDPLMQSRFVELILEEKKRGATILMSSHIFEEIEKTCDRTAIINAGRLLAIEEMENFKQKKNRKFVVTYRDGSTEEFKVKNAVGNEMNDLIRKLSNRDVLDIRMVEQTLEEIFMNFYKKDSEREVQ